MYQEDKTENLYNKSNFKTTVGSDHSTSAVDTKTDALIRKAFREKIPNTTKIIIAQRVSSIEDADQIGSA